MITQKNIKAVGAELEKSLMLELIVRSTLDADYRRALLQNELAKLSDSKANKFMDRVLGLLHYDDPLVVLMMQKA